MEEMGLNTFAGLEGESCSVGGAEDVVEFGLRTGFKRNLDACALSRRK